MFNTLHSCLSTWHHHALRSRLLPVCWGSDTNETCCALRATNFSSRGGVLVRGTKPPPSSQVGDRSRPMIFVMSHKRNAKTFYVFIFQRQLQACHHQDIALWCLMITIDISISRKCRSAYSASSRHREIANCSHTTPSES